MDSSSDGSFAWTDASNDTIDSGPMSNNNIIKTHSEDESVSGKSYKKKLQKELFAQSNGSVKKEAGEQLLSTHKPTYTGYGDGQADGHHGPPNKNNIKREPHSDIDIGDRNYKGNGPLSNNSQESKSKINVKAEQELASPPRKKTKNSKHKSILCDSDILSDDSCATENKVNINYTSNETNVEENKLNQLVQEENDNYDKKVKKKKKRTKIRKDSSMSDVSYQQDGNVDREVSATMEDGSQSPSQYTPTEFPQNSTCQLQSALTSTVTNNTFNLKDSTNGRNEETAVNKSVYFNVLDASTTRTPRISERIQFEEDESSEMETSQLQINKTCTKSSKLKTFLKKNVNLKPSQQQLESESVLTVDDEIWIVRCPEDVDINAFQDKNLALQGKCKLKLNGQTYEGTVNNETENISVFSTECNKFIIKSLSMNGFINFHRRIPKCQIQDELMHGNPPSFIPLPETKCRHPLFGSNYRKAIKLPNAVAERLRERATPRAADALPPAASPPPSVSRKRGRDSFVKPDLDTDQKKKKKKRKHSDSEELPPKKKKRLKHDLESAEAWESEQAIEENLFNF